MVLKPPLDSIGSMMQVFQALEMQKARQVDGHNSALSLESNASGVASNPIPPGLGSKTSTLACVSCSLSLLRGRSKMGMTLSRDHRETWLLSGS